jgi:hypothetical protein
MPYTRIFLNQFFLETMPSRISSFHALHTFLSSLMVMGYRSEVKYSGDHAPKN